jgi:uncharacterized protein (UPF0332 family)
MTPEEALVIRKAKDNLDAAELLIGQGFIEIAASRAYYTMFYLAEALLMRKGLHFSSHSAVIAAFGKEYAKTGEVDSKYHQYLIKAQAIRQISDYGYNEPLPKNDVEVVIRWAREFFQVVEDYLQGE